MNKWQWSCTRLSQLFDSFGSLSRHSKFNANPGPSSVSSLSLVSLASFRSQLSFPASPTLFSEIRVSVADSSSVPSPSVLPFFSFSSQGRLSLFSAFCSFTLKFLLFSCLLWNHWEYTREKPHCCRFAACCRPELYLLSKFSSFREHVLIVH